MPLTSYGEPQMLQALFGSNTSGIPSTYYVGLITSSKGIYSAQTYNVGDLVIPSNFSTAATNKLYRCVATSGSAASGTVTFNTTAGALTQDATSSTTWWQEVTPYFYGTIGVLSSASGTGSLTSVACAQGTNQATGTPLTTALPSGTVLTITSPNGAVTQNVTTTGTPSVSGSGSTYSGSGSNYVGATTLSFSSTSFATTLPIGSTIALASSTSGYYATEVASSNNYARQSVTNSQSSAFAAPQTPSPFITTSGSSTYGSTTNYTTAITFPSGSTTSGGSWGNVCGFFLASSQTQGAGSVYAWNTLSNYVPMLTSGMQITLPATTGITVTLS